MMKLNVLLMKDGEAWSAQCLEHNIAAQGNTTNDAILELARTIAGELHLRAENGQEGLDDIPRAPDFYWQRFGKANSLNVQPPLVRLDQSTPPSFMIPKFEDCRVA